MTHLQSIDEQQIKDRAYAVLTTAYEELSYQPNIRLATEIILASISHLTGFQIVTRVIPKDAMAELRGMLLTFETGSDFLAYLEAKVPDPQFDVTGITATQPVALIFVSSANNPCWYRFTLVKEAAHLVIEREDLLLSTQVAHLVEAVVKSGSFASKNNSVLVNREDAGVKAAIEIFMPDSSKPWVESQVNVKKAGPLQIAQQLMIPQRFVEQRFLEWGLPLSALKSPAS